MQKKIEVTLETVTPLYMGGADPDQQPPELRTPSIRGAMRYWLRAFLGAHLGDHPEQVWKAESLVFGDTESTSSVNLRITPVNVPQAQQINFSLDSGKGYLLWTTTRTQRSALPAKTTRFRVIVASRPFQGDRSGLVLNQALASLWLLANLGGLGTRSRRGLGSVRITEANNWPDELPPPIPATGVNLTEFLRRGVDQLHATVIPGILSSISSPTSFDILHSNTCAILVGQVGQKNWEMAIENIGNTLRDFRSYRPPDHDGVLDVIKKGAPPNTVRRAAFGLPMQFYFRQYHEDMAKNHPDWAKDKKRARSATRKLATADVVPGARDIDRRASPLQFKVASVSEVELVPVVTFFNARFLPGNNPLVRINPRDRNASSQNVAAPDYSILQEFLAGLHWSLAYGRVR